MRDSEEIILDISETREKIHELEKQLLVLEDELCEREFDGFCYLFGVKKGDIVRITKKRTKEFDIEPAAKKRTVIIDGMDRTRLFWIRVRKIRKNSEPSKSVEYMLPNEFENCQIIGHVDDN